MSSLDTRLFPDKAAFSSTQSAGLAWSHPPEFSLSKDVQYCVELADSLDDLRDAQRLRYNVFHQEYGAEFLSKESGLDADEFDAYCDHLVVRHVPTGALVGTYRVLLPQQAKRLGRYYAQGEFFMTRLERQVPDLVELGRSCVHPEHRNGSVIMLLWAAIARYMAHHQYTNLIGCASVSMRDGGVLAAGLWNQFQGSAYLADPLLEAFPKNPVQLEGVERLDKSEPPALMRAYLKMGALICSAPNWDPDFNTADFLLLLDLKKMSDRYARHFGINRL